MCGGVGVTAMKGQRPRDSNRGRKSGKGALFPVGGPGSENFTRKFVYVGVYGSVAGGR